MRVTMLDKVSAGGASRWGSVASSLVRLSYAKVSEYQRRGLVHLHPVIRLDRRMPAYRADELRAQRALAQLAPAERTSTFEFVGVGHLTTADAYLAAQAAARAREERELAREALMSGVR